MIVSGIIMRPSERRTLAELMYEACKEKLIQKLPKPERAYALSLQIVEAYIDKKDLEELSQDTDLDVDFLSDIIDDCDSIFTDAAVEKARQEKPRGIFNFPTPFFKR